MSQRIKWGDVDDTDSPNTVSKHSNELNIKPGTIHESVDKNTGIKTIVEYTTNTDGKLVRITRHIKQTTKSIQVNKSVVARRQLKKFGEARNAGPGPEFNVTIPSNELITLDLSTKKNRNDNDEKEESALDKLKGGSSIVVCSYCKEPGHFSLKCPKRSQLAPRDLSKPNDLGLGPDTEHPQANAAATSTGSKYVPMHMRNAAGKDSTRDTRSDEPTLRVTNLSEDVTEADLHELFRRFGRTSRIFLAKDRITNLSRGFAYINYDNRADAQAAIDKLNGHGYDNLILHVEWAKTDNQR